MKYIQNRDSFKSGLIIKESLKTPIIINEAWTEKYDTLPDYKDSYGGRLLSFIFRKGVEKVNSARVSSLLTDLENAINESVIEDVKKNEEFAKTIKETEQKSFIAGIWAKIKGSKTTKDFKKLEETITSEAEVMPKENYPMNIQIVLQYLDQRIVNVTNITGDSKEEEKSDKEETNNVEDKENTVVSNSNTSITHDFITDLLSSKNPVEMLKDKQIKKEFFLGLKSLMSDVNYGPILISLFDDKLKNDLNQLSIFSKKKTNNAGTEQENTTVDSTITDKNKERDSKLDKISQMKKDRLAKQQELQNKPKGDKKDILTNINKIEKKALHESVDNIQADTLSLRDDSIKKLLKALNSFLGDKRIKKETVISKFFGRVNKLYTEFIGDSGNESTSDAVESNATPVDKEVFNPEKEITQDDVQSLLPVLYKKMDEEEKKESTGLIKLLNQGFKQDGDNITIESQELDSEMKKMVSETNTEIDPKLDEQVEKSTKAASIDPLEIVRIFNRANKLMIVNYMPSNRSGGKVSRNVANNYETLDGGAPSLENSNGPYRQKKLWSKWNDGVLSLFKKYKEILDTTKYITYENGRQEIKKANGPIIKFMNDMLNDSRATGGKEAHQVEFIDKYFGLERKDADSYSKHHHGYNAKKGDIFYDYNKGGVSPTDKEQTTTSASNEALFTDKKKDGSKIDKIVLQKMRDSKFGYAFSFEGIVDGLNNTYDGKSVTFYCVGIQVFGTDHVLFKMSINNDWFVSAYNGQIKYTSEREEDRKKNLVYLMLCNRSAVLTAGGKLNFNCMPTVGSDKIADEQVHSVTVTGIKNLRILQGTDGFMMRMDKIDSKKKSPKDIIYAKKDTFDNIYNKLKMNEE